MALVSGIDGSSRLAVARSWSTRMRLRTSVVAIGTGKRIRVMRLPPTGSSSLRMLIGMVTRSSATALS